MPYSRSFFKVNECFVNEDLQSLCPNQFSKETDQLLNSIPTLIPSGVLNLPTEIRQV
jgi:hypothetical protein